MLLTPTNADIIFIHERLALNRKALLACAAIAMLSKHKDVTVTHYPAIGAPKKEEK